LRPCIILLTGFCNGLFYPEAFKPVPYPVFFISLLYKQKGIYPDTGCVTGITSASNPAIIDCDCCILKDSSCKTIFVSVNIQIFTNSSIGMIIQFCGLSGSGKTTLARKAKEYFDSKRVSLEIIDGDEYRKVLCSDLGFTKADRYTNIRRLAFVADKLSRHDIIPVICAINPYEEIRREVATSYREVKTIYIKCSLVELFRRDTKGLYARTLLPENDSHYLHNLSGVSDPFEIPSDADLTIETDIETISESSQKLIAYIESTLAGHR
jgi:adenylylsulfate kinase